MEAIYERCCGLDIQKRIVVACVIVPSSSAQVRKEIRTFANGGASTFFTTPKRKCARLRLLSFQVGSRHLSPANPQTSARPGEYSRRMTASWDSSQRW